MKKILLFFITIISLFSSCKKNNVEFIFDKQPEERVAEKLDSLQTALLSSPYGWKAALNTKASGGYGFYVDFRPDQTLSMLSDFSTSSSTVLKESTYRVTWTMNAVLMFDTYNYITMLQDPTPSVNGGTPGNGLQSDIEFELLKITADTLTLQGKRYGNVLRLVKLKQSEQKDYLDGKYKNSIDAIAAYFKSHTNNYFKVDDIESKIEFTLTTGKSAIFQYINSEKGVSNVSGKFNYDLAGLNFNDPVAIGNKSFVKAILDGNDLYLVTTDGQRIKLLQNTQPILPLESVYGYNRTYKILGTPNDVNTLPEILINTTFPDLIKNTVTKFGTVKFRHFEFKFESSKQLSINIYYYSTANFTATMYFDYTLVDGVLTLSNPTNNTTGNWNTRRSVLRELEDYLINNSPYKTDWMPNQVGTPLVGWYSMTNPNNVIFGNLK